jgi:general secretion pathway protein I
MRTAQRNGFTLIEMLVALSILSLAALALVRLDAFALRNTAEMESGALARIVAANAAADVLSAPAAPAIGSATASVSNGGRSWQVTTRTQSTADPNIVRVDILATGVNGRAVLTFVRPAGGAP